MCMSTASEPATLDLNPADPWSDTYCPTDVTCDPWPWWVERFRDAQLDAVEAVLDGYARGKRVMVVDAPVGCLSGESLMALNRGGKGYKARLDRMVTSFNGGANYGKFWDLSIPTRAQCAKDGVFSLGTVSAAYYSGEKVTYTVKAGGAEIRSTLDHRFMTEDGWRELRDISPGLHVAINGGKGSPAPLKPKPVYKYVGFLDAHPFAKWNGPKNEWRVLKHRLVAEATLNDLEFEEYKQRLKRGDVDGLTFIDPSEYDVHHIDHDHQNNSPDNLEILTPTEHQQRHAEEGSTRHVLDQVKWVAVEQVTKWGEESTFDITMESEPHNFVANGFVVHNSGKTLLAEMVRRRLGERMLYVAHSRGLQDQFARDFPYSRVLKGRSNYPTRFQPYPDVSAADCTKAKCRMCGGMSNCEYQIARTGAKQANVAVVNTAYLLAESRVKDGLCSGFQFRCIDECDTLEGILAGSIGFRLGEQMVGEWGLEAPVKGAHGKTIAEWLEREWCPAAIRELSVLRSKLEAGVTDQQEIKLRRELDRLQDKFVMAKMAGKGIRGDEGYGAWVRDYEWEGARSPAALLLKPVMVDWAGQARVWNAGAGPGTRYLCMSGTVTDGEIWARGLGLEDGEWEMVTVPMSFPRENRPVRLVPLGSMAKKQQDKNKAAVFAGVLEALRRHEGENVLVHTVSYQLSREVLELVRGSGLVPRDKLHGYASARDRDVTLEGFKERGGVIVGPSLDRGVDLPGDLCRVQIVVKVPFPNLGDRVVSERMRGEGGRRWYATETARTIVQMTGRGVRGVEDWAVTYVLDSDFMRWWNGEGKGLMPGWWNDAVEVERVRDWQ